MGNNLRGGKKKGKKEKTPKTVIINPRGFGGEKCIVWERKNLKKLEKFTSEKTRV